MKNLLSKSMISKSIMCGVLASTFFVINCQKAPERKKTGGNDALAKQQSVVAACSKEFTEKMAPAMKKTMDEAKTLLDKIKQENPTMDPSKVDAATKEQLTKLLETITSQTTEGINDIKKQKVADKVAEACNIVDAADPKKVLVTYVVADMNQTVARHRSVINQLLGVAPQGGDQQTGGDQTAPVEQNDTVLSDDTVIIKDQIVMFRLDLAKNFDEVLKQEGIFVSEGKVLFLNSNKEEIEKLQAEAKVSYCKISVFGGKLEKDTSMLVLDVSEPATKEGDKVSTVDLSISDEDGKLHGLTCSIPLEKVQNKSKELRAVLGALAEVHPQAKKQ